MGPLVEGFAYHDPADRPCTRYHRDVRRFHQSVGVVLGYDETAFPDELVRVAREAWKALLPARSMRFHRQDLGAPASLLLSLGSYPDIQHLRVTLERLRSPAAHPAREALCQLFRACTKPHPEFQFRYDLGAVMVRGRFTPTHPEEVGTALDGLAELAEALERTSLPAGVMVVVAAYRGRWQPERAYGFDPAAGCSRAYRYQDGVWQLEVS